MRSRQVANLDPIKQSQYARLVGLFSAEALEAFSAVKSIVLYGWVSRGVANTGATSINWS